MEGLLKALLDKISLEIFFMTLFLSGLSLFGLFFFANQISFVFLVAYCCVSISVSYALSCCAFRTFNLQKNKKKEFEVSCKLKHLTDIEKNILIELLVIGESGLIIKSEDKREITNLSLLNLVFHKKHIKYEGNVFIINPYYSEILKTLLNQTQAHSVNEL